MRILLAEDERTMAEPITAFLQYHKYTVDWVDNGADAYRQAVAQTYDGLILDIMMPEMDGLTVLSRLRREGKNMPVLLLTAKSEIEDRIRGLDSGADDYLPKPFDMSELLARVRAMLRRRDTYHPENISFGGMPSFDFSKMPDGDFGGSFGGSMSGMPDGGSFSARPGGDGDAGDSASQVPERPSGGGQGGGFGFNFFNMGGGEKSASDLAMALNYVGDDLETYQEIWDSAKFKTDGEDHARVVNALKHVSERDDIGSYVDVDNVLRYMAIQAFIYNSDGLTGTVSHNYYLYEENGKLNLIPWDMNESFSVSGDGNDFVNFPIDTPFTVSDLSQRDFFMALLENEEYMAQYHAYLRQLSEEYALGGGLEAAYDRIRSQIDTLVEADPTAFSTYEKYDAAAKSLKLAVELRAKGVLAQLNGEVPSTREGQEAEPDKIVDVSGEDLSGLTSGYGMGKNFTMTNFPGKR